MKNWNDNKCNKYIHKIKITKTYHFIWKQNKERFKDLKTFFNLMDCFMKYEFAIFSDKIDNIFHRKIQENNSKLYF